MVNHVKLNVEIKLSTSFLKSSSSDSSDLYSLKDREHEIFKIAHILLFVYQKQIIHK